MVKKPSHATVPLSFSVEVPTWTVLVMSLFYGLISLLAFLGNSLVIYVVATSRRMQVSPHHTLLHSASYCGRAENTPDDRKKSTSASPVKCGNYFNMYSIVSLVLASLVCVLYLNIFILTS
jgi:hypothetical protein